MGSRGVGFGSSGTSTYRAISHGNPPPPTSCPPDVLPRRPPTLLWTLRPCWKQTSCYVSPISNWPCLRLRKLSRQRLSISRSDTGLTQASKLDGPTYCTTLSRAGAFRFMESPCLGNSVTCPLRERRLHSIISPCAWQPEEALVSLRHSRGPPSTPSTHHTITHQPHPRTTTSSCCLTPSALLPWPLYSSHASSFHFSRCCHMAGLGGLTFSSR